MPTAPLSSRRSLLKGGAGLIAATAAPAWLTPARAQGKTLRPTPGQTEGPYYPVAFPADTDFDLLRTGAAAYGKGQPAWVSGTVTDTRGVPLAGGVIEIWQCDQDGHYHHPGDGGRADPTFQGFGKVTLGKDGGLPKLEIVSTSATLTREDIVKALGEDAQSYDVRSLNLERSK